MVLVRHDAAHDAVAETAHAHEKIERLGRCEERPHIVDLPALLARLVAIEHVDDAKSHLPRRRHHLPHLRQRDLDRAQPGHGDLLQPRVFVAFPVDDDDVRDHLDRPAHPACADFEPITPRSHCGPPVGNFERFIADEVPVERHARIELRVEARVFGKIESGRGNEARLQTEDL
jgi:hypothetical protein